MIGFLPVSITSHQRPIILTTNAVNSCRFSIDFTRFGRLCRILLLMVGKLRFSLILCLGIDHVVLRAGPIIDFLIPEHACSVGATSCPSPGSSVLLLAGVGVIED